MMVPSGSPPEASTQYDFTAAPNAVALSGDVGADGLTDLAAFDPAATPQWKFATGDEGFATTTPTGDDLMLDEPASGESRVYDNSAIDTSP